MNTQFAQNVGKAGKAYKARKVLKMPNKTRDKLINIILIDASVPNMIQEKPYTAIEMVFEFNNKVFAAKGFSKVKYPDEWNDEFGFSLACLKAAAKIAKEVGMNKELLNSILDKENESQTEVSSNSL